MSSTMFSWIPATWLPFTLFVVALLMGVLLVLVATLLVQLVLAIRGHRRKSMARVSALLALLAALVACTILLVANHSRTPIAPARLVNVPAPPSLSLAFFQLPDTTPATVVALDARTGARRWQQSFGTSQVRVAADAHTLYVTKGADVVALRGSDGTRLWQTPLNTPTGAPEMSVTAAPILADGMVYVSAYVFSGGVRSGGGVLYALRAVDGALAWSLPLGEDYHEDLQVYPLAAGQGMVFVGSSIGTVAAFRSGDGAPAWSWHATPDQAYQVVPFFGGGMVYAAGYRQVFALHAGDGTLLWSHPLASPLVNHQLGIGASSIYYEQVEQIPDVNPDYLYSLSSQTGDIRWKYQVANAAHSTAIEAGPLVYYASDRYLDALSVSDGQRVWRHRSNTNVGFGAPLIVGDVLFVKSLVVFHARFGATCPPDCEPAPAVNALTPATGALYWRSAWSALDPSAPLGVSDP